LAKLHGNVIVDQRKFKSIGTKSIEYKTWYLNKLSAVPTINAVKYAHHKYSPYTSKHATFLLLELFCIRLALRPQSPEALLRFWLHLRSGQAIAEEATGARSRTMCARR
jgi:hypothetical protein